MYLTSGTMHSIQTARKQWRCDAGYTCTKAHGNPDHTREKPANLIEPGERYEDFVYPPWLLTQDDPDSAPTKLGGWVHHRFHIDCTTF